MNYLAITKKIVSTVVGLGVSKIVHDIIANNVDVSSTAQKVSVGSASIVLGMAAADATKDYTDRQIDELAALWYKYKKPTETVSTEH